MQYEIWYSQLPKGSLHIRHMHILSWHLILHIRIVAIVSSSSPALPSKFFCTFHPLFVSCCNHQIHLLMIISLSFPLSLPFLSLLLSLSLFLSLSILFPLAMCSSSLITISISVIHSPSRASTSSSTGAATFAATGAAAAPAAEKWLIGYLKRKEKREERREEIKIESYLKRPVIINDLWLVDIFHSRLVLYNNIYV